ncbi:MAG: hypothetical protein ABI083_12090 [Lapillicoccus sp.]
MTPPPSRPRAWSLLVLAVVHVVLAAAATAFVVALFVSGLQPNAELQGVLVVVGAVLALPTLAYLTLSVRCLVAVHRGTPRGVSLSFALAIIDALVGAAFVAALIYAVMQRDSLSGSPLFFGLAPLMTGVVGLLVVTSLRRAPHPVG